MLPVEVKLDPAVGIPVHAKVEQADVVGPELAVSEAILEDDTPQIELTEANERLDGPWPPSRLNGRNGRRGTTVVRRSTCSPVMK